MNPENSKRLTGVDGIESLRLILEAKQCCPVTYEEAQEVGESLICFFEVLADNSNTDQETTLQGTA